MKRWRELAVRVWSASDKDDVLGMAAQLSYFFLLAIFPFLLFLTTLLGFLASTGNDVYEHLLSYAREMLPYSAFELVVDTLKQVHAGADPGKLSIGILATIWASSSGMSAVMQGLNRAYEMKESRPWWKAKLLSVVLTVSLSGFVIIATALVVHGNRIAEVMAGYFGLETYFTATWKLLQWPVALAFLLLVMSLLYRFAPARRRPWRWVWPGAVVAMALWVIVSLGFRLYLHFFNSYNATYGSLGAVIVLLLWFYLSGAAILLGAELNNELSKASVS